VLENYFAKKAFEEAKKAGKITDPNAFPDPAFAKGPIQLQTHGSEIRWRNLFIREIPAEEANRIVAGSDKGFVRLDNGKNLSGWQGAVENYEVVEGAIVCKPGKGGNLLSKEEFGDLTLRFEFKLPSGGNNGIALRTPLNGHPASDGLEIQVIDNDGYNAAHPKAPLKDFQYHGSIYHCVGAKAGYLRPVGKWNFEEITVKDQRITVTVNGFKILDAELAKIDRSKMTKPPGGLDRLTGHIGFAGHNDPVAFRNVRVKRLASNSVAAAKPAPAKPATALTKAPASAAPAKPAATASEPLEVVVTSGAEPVIDTHPSYLEDNALPTVEAPTSDSEGKKTGKKKRGRGHGNASGHQVRTRSMFSRNAFLSHARS
jgi:hypothetical protein